MEENKNNCEGKMCGGCHGCQGHGCGMHKCHALRWLIKIFILLLVFCLGIQFGEFKSESRGNYRFYRGDMTDWNYQNVKPLDANLIPPTTGVPTQSQTATQKTTPEVKQ